MGTSPGGYSVYRHIAHIVWFSRQVERRLRPEEVKIWSRHGEKLEEIGV
jgi:hypothetical protein